MKQLPGLVVKAAFREYENKKLRTRAADLQRSIKRLSAARRRLLRFARSSCNARRAKLKHIPRGALGRRVQAAGVTATCAADRASALSQYGSHLEKLIDELAYTKSLIGVKRRKSRTTARERHQEQIEREAYDVPPELRPLWDRIGKSKRFAPTAHADRFERFMHFVHENPDEVIDAAQNDAEQFLAEMIKEYQQQGAESSPPF